MTESGRNVGPTNNNQAVQAWCRLALHSALITSVVMRVYRRRYVYFIPYNASRGSRASRKLPDRLPLIYETPTIVFLAREFYRRHPLLLYFTIASKHTVTKEENIEGWWRESSIYIFVYFTS